MLRFRSHILLTHKIAAIGATGVLGVAVMGAIYLIGASIQDKYRRVAESAQAMLEQANELSVKLLESRRAEKDFLLRNDMKYVDRHRSLNGEIGGHLDTLRQQAAAGERYELASKIDAVRDGIKSYAAHFAALAQAKERLGLNENAGLEGALRRSVHAIETKLNELKEQRLLVTMLMMRRHEKDFMLRRDRKYGDDMKKRATEFSGALESLDVAPAVKTELKLRLSDYQRDFFAW